MPNIIQTELFCRKNVLAEVVTIKNMLADGMTEFVECGPGQVLTGLVGRMMKG